MSVFHNKQRYLSKYELFSESTECGRSMVEMLGVLVVIGVLSIGAISGYRYAMNKYRANQVINDVNLRAMDIKTALAVGKSTDLNEWQKRSSAGYLFEDPVWENGKVSLSLLDVPATVCEKIVEGMPHYSIVINDTDTVCHENTSGNKLTFFFDQSEMLGSQPVSCDSHDDCKFVADSPYCNESSGVCESCPEGQLWNDAWEMCVCPDGSVWNEESTSCDIVSCQQAMIDGGYTTGYTVDGNTIHWDGNFNHTNKKLLDLRGCHLVASGHIEVKESGSVLNANSITAQGDYVWIYQNAEANVYEVTSVPKNVEVYYSSNLNAQVVSGESVASWEKSYLNADKIFTRGVVHGLYGGHIDVNEVNTNRVRVQSDAEMTVNNLYATTYVEVYNKGTLIVLGDLEAGTYVKVYQNSTPVNVLKVDGKVKAPEYIQVTNRNQFTAACVETKAGGFTCASTATCTTPSGSSSIPNCE